MVSNILLFLLFAAGTVGVFYLVPLRLRKTVLLVSSGVFYGIIDPFLLMLVGATAFWTWFTAMKLEATHGKKWFLAGLIPVIACLFVFKYFNFFCSSVASLLSAFGVSFDGRLLQLAMPLGISYYTFKLIAYIVDIYYKKYTTEKAFTSFLTYVIYFPQIVCGPIQRPEHFLNQLSGMGKKFDVALFDRGIRLIILGLFKKLVLANALLPLIDGVYKKYDTMSGMTLAIAAVMYSFYIYFDFSGYSDIAIGSGNLMGIRCPKNFNAPYFSKNIVEFWQRWHISLTSWLKDYIYIPLGGNRVGSIRKKWNIIAVFLVSGLWHGANWTFIFWGLLHGLWNVVTPRRKNRLPKSDCAQRQALPVAQENVTDRGVGFARMASEENHQHQEKQGNTSPVIMEAKQDCVPTTRSWKTIGRWLRDGMAVGATFFGVTLGWIFFRSENITSACQYIVGIFTHFRVSLDALMPFFTNNTSVVLFVHLWGMIFLYFVFEWFVIYNRDHDHKPIPTGWTAVFLAAILLFGKFGQSGFLYANF